MNIFVMLIVVWVILMMVSTISTWISSGIILKRSGSIHRGISLLPPPGPPPLHPPRPPPPLPPPPLLAPLQPAKPPLQAPAPHPRPPVGQRPAPASLRGALHLRSEERYEEGDDEREENSPRKLHSVLSAVGVRVERLVAGSSLYAAPLPGYTRRHHHHHAMQNKQAHVHCYQGTFPEG